MKISASEVSRAPALGIGFDTLTGSLRGQALSLPEAPRRVTLNAGPTSISVCNRTAEVDRSFSLSASAELSFLCGGASGFVNFTRELRTSERSVAVILHARRLVYEEAFPNAGGLSGGAGEVLRQNPRAFLTAFGNTYVSSVTYGYTLDLVLQIDAKSSRSANSLKTKIELTSVFGGADVRVESFNQLRTEEVQLSLFAYTEGLPSPAMVGLPKNGNDWNTVVQGWLALLSPEMRATANPLPSAAGLSKQVAPIEFDVTSYDTISEIVLNPDAFDALLVRQTLDDASVGLGKQLQDVRERVRRLEQVLRAPNEYLRPANPEGFRARHGQLLEFLNDARLLVRRAALAQVTETEIRSLQPPAIDATEEVLPVRVPLSVVAHVSNRGDITGAEGEFVGTREAILCHGIAVQCTDPLVPLSINYEVVCPELGGEIWQRDGQLAGSRGIVGVRVTSFKIWLEGAAKAAYSIRYKGHFDFEGETTWYCDGQACQASGRYLEGLVVEVVPVVSG